MGSLNALKQLPLLPTLAPVILNGLQFFYICVIAQVWQLAFIAVLNFSERLWLMIVMDGRWTLLGDWSKILQNDLCQSQPTLASSWLDA